MRSVYLYVCRHRLALQVVGSAQRLLKPVLVAPVVLVAKHNTTIRNKQQTTNNHNARPSHPLNYVHPISLFSSAQNPQPLPPAFNLRVMETVKTVVQEMMQKLKGIADAEGVELSGILVLAGLFPLLFHRNCKKILNKGLEIEINNSPLIKGTRKASAWGMFVKDMHKRGRVPEDHMQAGKNTKYFALCV